MITIQAMDRSQWPEVARLIHDSTNSWYRNRGLPEIFSHGPQSTLLFCEVYESLDPGCCLVAFDSDSNEIVGSCFWHPRTTHVSLGIMNVHPSQFGRGIGTRLLREITDIADQRNLPVRLVASAMNLNSFSLYNRAGFAPQAVFQDMLISVTDNTIEAGKTHSSEHVRPATDSDIPCIVRLEHELLGIKREQDFHFFLRNELQIWNTLVIESPTGECDGFLTAIRHPCSNMIGPGAARTESAMIALTSRMLSFHRNNTAIMLVPATAGKLAYTLYQWGAKNCELHLSQVRGNSQLSSGVIVPSFMPESG